MNKIKKKIILNAEKLETRFALLKNDRLEEFQIERPEDGPVAGDIYLGRIANLESSLQAAFVDIGGTKNAFLHYTDMLESHENAMKTPDATPKRSHNTKKMSARSKLEQSRRKGKPSLKDIPELFKPGTELLVQIAKSPMGTKGARLTTDIAIAGRFLVLMPFSDHIGISNKIESSAERSRLRKILNSLELPEGMGLICRTVGEGRKNIFFKNDLDLLLDHWHKIEEMLASHKKAPLKVYSEPTLIERSVRDFMTEEIDEIIIDSQEAYNNISQMVKHFGGKKTASKVHRYDKAMPIYEYYRINEQLSSIHDRKVQLPSGGYICIDETEALIAIDVNSGSSRKGVDHPEMILQTNLEAANEIARQLRLRNVGGLVVLDFIDMRNARDRDEVYKTMRKLVKDDRAKTMVLPLSKLGLMEMTRQREHESLLDTVFDQCPYCKGSGRVKSSLSMSVEIQRQLKSKLRDRKFRKVGALRVLMHPEVLTRLKEEDAQLLSELEEEFSHELSFRADPELHYESFKVINPETGEEL